MSTNPVQRDWQFSFIDICIYEILSDDPREEETIGGKAHKFHYDILTWTLYRWSYDRIFLRCLSPQEAQKILKEAHDGMCGPHQPGPKHSSRLRKLRYYWPQMNSDAVNYAKRCHAHQIHGNFIHQALGH